MALSWDITKVEDYKNKCWVPVDEPGKVEVSFKVHPITDAIIWACMAVDMQRITVKNAEAHIGLWTNVSTRTKGQFHKRVVEIMRDSTERKIQYERESAGGEE